MAYSYQTLALELHARGLSRPDRTPLSLNGLTTILRNPFYMGLVRLRTSGETFQGVHEPLISPSLFRKVQDIIDTKSNTKTQRFDFAYRRMLTCGLCHYKLIGELQKGQTYYRCHTRGCATKGIREDMVTAQLLEATKDLQFSDEEIAQILPLLGEDEKGRASNRNKAITSLKLHIAALEGRDLRLTDAYVEQVFDRETYTGRRASLLMELAEARENLARQSAQVDEEQAQPQRFLELIKAFVLGPDGTSPADYRRLLETLTSNCTLIRKNLYVAMLSPFQEIIDDTSILFGVPHHDASRICGAENSATNIHRMPPGESISKQRARILLKHLATWEPPAFLTYANDNEEKKSQPQWFKRSSD